MTTTSIIANDINNFVTQQNQTRGGPIAGGGTVPLDYNALTGPVPSGGNTVTGISGIAAGAASISLPSSQIGNAVIIDGAVSTTASTSGADSYSFIVNATGAITITDNNTGNSEAITGTSYLVFDGGATTSSGAYQQSYIVASGVNAQIAEMFNSALGREPDFPGLEYYAIPTANGTLSLHQDAVYFLASPEFAKLYPALTAPADNGGPNDQKFISELYGNILHRTPSATEVQYYGDSCRRPRTASDLFLNLTGKSVRRLSLQWWLANQSRQWRSQYWCSGQRSGWASIECSDRSGEYRAFCGPDIFNLCDDKPYVDCWRGEHRVGPPHSIFDHIYRRPQHDHRPECRHQCR